MFFKNLNIYRLPKSPDNSTDGIAQLIEAMPLQKCGSQDAQSIGWVPVRDNGAFAHIVNGQILLALGVEQRLLPSSVVKQFANDRAKAIEEAEGRRVGRKEMRELCEAATQELLPRAFIRRRTTFAWIDPVNGWLVVDAASHAKAEELLEHLRKSVDGFPVKLLQVMQSPCSAMTGWVASGEAPAGFTIDQDLRLQSAENAQVTYAKHTLEGEDVRHQIAEGKVATKLAMTWGDRISFILADTLQIKRVSFIDIIKEQNDGQAENAEELFDLDFTLMTGELARMLDDIVSALGGEIGRDAVVESDAKTIADEITKAAGNISRMLHEDGATATISGPSGETLATFGGEDPMYAEARMIVTTNQRASISLIQRHLAIGYNRASRLIERMESDGVVSKMNSVGVREVMVRS